MESFCFNCGFNQLEMQGIDANGGMYKCLKCKAIFSVKFYKEGTVIHKKVPKELEKPVVYNKKEKYKEEV